MSVANDKTDDLMKTLVSIKKSSAGEYLERFDAGDAGTGFAEFISEMLAARKLKRQTVIQRADLPQKYGYKLLSCEKRTSERDYILRLTIATGLTLDETRRAIELYRMPWLYPKDPRDAILIIAINNRLSVDETNELLRDHGKDEMKRPK